MTEHMHLFGDRLNLLDPAELHIPETDALAVLIVARKTTSLLIMLA